MGFPTIKTTTRVSNAGATATTGNLSVAAGDLIVAQLFGAATGSESVSDNQSDSYTQRLADNSFGGNNGCAIFSGIVTSTSTTFTVSGTCTGGSADLSVVVIDGTTILGSSTYYDQGATSNDAGASVTTADSGNTAACAGGDELVLGFLLSGTSTTASAGTGFSLDGQTAGNGTTVMAVEHKTQTGVTSGVNATFGCSPSALVYCQVVVIRGTASAGSLPLPPVRRDRWRPAQVWAAIR